MATLSKDKLSFGEITVTGNGVKTIAQLLVEIMAQITDLTKLKSSTHISMYDRAFFDFHDRSLSGVCNFNYAYVASDSEFIVESIILDFGNNTASYKFYRSSTGTITDNSAAVVTNGETIKLCF